MIDKTEKIKQGLLLSYVVRVSVILIECEYRWEKRLHKFFYELIGTQQLKIIGFRKGDLGTS